MVTEHSIRRGGAADDGQYVRLFASSTVLLRRWLAASGALGHVRTAAGIEAAREAIASLAIESRNFLRGY